MNICERKSLSDLPRNHSDMLQCFPGLNTFLSLDLSVYLRPLKLNNGKKISRHPRLLWFENGRNFNYFHSNINYFNLNLYFIKMFNCQNISCITLMISAGYLSNRGIASGK